MGKCSYIAFPRVLPGGVLNRIFLDVVDELVNLREGQGDNRVRSAVVDGDTAGRCVRKCGAGEADVRHVADTLVHGLG